MVVGPEVSCLVAVDETASVVKDDKNDSRYQEGMNRQFVPKSRSNYDTSVKIGRAALQGI